MRISRLFIVRCFFLLSLLISMFVLSGCIGSPAPPEIASPFPTKVPTPTFTPTLAPTSTPTPDVTATAQTMHRIYATATAQVWAAVTATAQAKEREASALIEQIQEEFAQWAEDAKDYPSGETWLPVGAGSEDDGVIVLPRDTLHLFYAITYALGRSGKDMHEYTQIYEQIQRLVLPVDSPYRLILILHAYDVSAGKVCYRPAHYFGSIIVRATYKGSKFAKFFLDTVAWDDGAQRWADYSCGSDAEFTLIGGYSRSYGTWPARAEMVVGLLDTRTKETVALGGWRGVFHWDPTVGGKDSFYQWVYRDFKVFTPEEARENSLWDMHLKEQKLP